MKLRQQQALPACFKVSARVFQRAFRPGQAGQDFGFKQAVLGFAVQFLGA